MSAPPAAEVWLKKLEQWLRDNHDPDVIYTVMVGHRAGYSAVVTNIDQRHVLDFIAKTMTKNEL